jgi:lipopolysaccharide/colanic/teichoic acid biosynthesis glycosyltransferase
MYKSYIKRLLDFSLSLLGFICLLPIFLLVTLFLMFANNGKAFFLQARPGKNGKIFKVIKYKTMNDKKGMDGQLLSDAERLTSIGRFIRKTSLDEVPQLLNVIKGDMSLVGPRPLLVEYLPLYNNEQAKRHNVCPGITGWAQINGRNAISWQQKFEYDVWYVNHISFTLDIRILLMTILKVFKSDGITSYSSVTMEKFEGTK